MRDMWVSGDPMIKQMDQQQRIRNYMPDVYKSDLKLDILSVVFLQNNMAG